MCVICGCSGSPKHAPARVAVRPIPPQPKLGTPVAAAEAIAVGGISRTRAIRMEADVLAANQQCATRNRDHFAAAGVRAFNLISSPGSGKTSLLCASIRALRSRGTTRGIAVIEGDQHTSIDAERIRASGAPAVQVNTGRICHLDAAMVATAFETLRGAGGGHGDPGRGVASGSLLFIENVGNLVCPALWDLGEAAKIVLLSVTEGDDKPLKYPDIFASARLMVINKIDLLPHVDFDPVACTAYARRVNPDIEVLLVSASRGDGMAAWLDRLLAWPLPQCSRASLHYRVPQTRSTSSAVPISAAACAPFASLVPSDSAAPSSSSAPVLGERHPAGAIP